MTQPLTGAPAVEASRRRPFALFVAARGAELAMVAGTAVAFWVEGEGRPYRAGRETAPCAQGTHPTCTSEEAARRIAQLDGSLTWAMLLLGLGFVTALCLAFARPAVRRTPSARHLSWLVGGAAVVASLAVALLWVGGGAIENQTAFEAMGAGVACILLYVGVLVLRG